MAFTRSGKRLYWPAKPRFFLLFAVSALLVPLSSVFQVAARGAFCYNIFVVVLFIAAFAVLFLMIIVVLMFKLYAGANADISPLVTDLKNELNELKTRQLESQEASLARQQRLFVETQRELGSQLHRMANLMGQNLASAQNSITAQLDNSNRVIGDIRAKLGALETTAKNMQEIGRDISSLQNILRAPKLRGNLGEYLLEELLKQSFPAKNYQMKYGFKNGTQVDAVIKLENRIVPIDSKFPLESFERLVAAADEESKKVFKKEFVAGVKKRVDEIADKYINPAENTFDFAMMYIPAENVFYETIINDSLTSKDYEILNYAMERQVIPVSPNSFYAYLMAIVYGLRGFKIEEEARSMLGELSRVRERFGRFFADYTLVGKHLSNAMSKYNESERSAERLNGEVDRVTGSVKGLPGE